MSDDDERTPLWVTRRRAFGQEHAHVRASFKAVTFRDRIASRPPCTPLLDRIAQGKGDPSFRLPPPIGSVQREDD
jgi:hypothetical protein